MFTKKSPRGNLFINMQSILACKIHILVCFIVLKSFPIHTRDLWVLKGVYGKLKVANFMKSCLLCKVASFVQSCDLYEMLQILEK